MGVNQLVKEMLVYLPTANRSPQNPHGYNGRMSPPNHVKECLPVVRNEVMPNQPPMQTGPLENQSLGYGSRKRNKTSGAQ